MADDAVVELQQNVLQRETRERRETRRETWGKSVTINIFSDKFKNDNGVLLSNFNDAIVVLHFRCVGRMSDG